MISTVTDYVGQQQAARRQEASVRESLRVADQQAQERYAQINADAAEKQSDRAREARIERARIRTAAGESGLGGLNSSLLEGEADAAAGYDFVRISGDRAASERATALEMQGVRTRAQSGLNQIRYPSLVQSGLQITGAYGEYKIKKAIERRPAPRRSPNA